MKASMVVFLGVLFGELFVYGYLVPGRCPVVRLANGRARPRSRGRVVRYSCFDGFTLVGNKYSTCEEGHWDTPTPVCVKAECPTPPVPEHALMAPKYDGAILMYFCKPGYKLIGSADIYCDGRQWNATPPHCRDTTAEAPTKCDFEKDDLCWWEQDPLHDFDWIRHNFDTPSYHLGTGPTHDHTLGPGNDGYYLYIEATGRLVNDSARIISPLYNSSLTESGCFSFWYHMFGSTVGTLNVYFKTEKQNTSLLMFSRHGNQGNQWLHGIFDLPKTDQAFQIIIEGIRGFSYVSDIAIDDVAILQGDKCVENKTETVGVTPSDEDQIEQVYATQSCRGKCKNTFAFNNLTTSRPKFSEICLCTLDCLEHSICCPDFAEYCILGVTEDGTTDGTEATIANREVAQATISSVKNESIITDIATRKPNYYGKNGISINPKDDIDPVTMKPTTKKPVTTAITMKTTNAAKTTTRSVLQTENNPTKKTAPVPVTVATEYTRLGKKADPNTRVQDPEKLHRGNSRFGLPGIIGLVIGVLTGLTITTTVALLILRRRKTYKRGSSGSALSEDSDVRFLTSDEILDFNLARPNDNDEP